MFSSLSFLSLGSLGQSCDRLARNGHNASTYSTQLSRQFFCPRTRSGTFDSAAEDNQLSQLSLFENRMKQQLDHLRRLQSIFKLLVYFTDLEVILFFILIYNSTRWKSILLFL